jgi:peptide-methionine (S)-S-oxide reductase
MPEVQTQFEIEDPLFRTAVELLDAGATSRLRELLQQHPNLIHQHVEFENRNYFNSPTLLNFVAENPIRNGKLPANIVEVVVVLLEAGANLSEINETLGLVASGRISRECNVQIALIDLLCEYGADPNTALHTAAVHGEQDALRSLLRHGAKLDLPVAAALGFDLEFDQLLSNASVDDRQLALAYAAQFGHVSMVTSLLDSGVDPNLYNPTGAHGHSTPLHQAAYAGHEEVVRLLVERGARLDLKDRIWQGTPADWAYHGDHADLETYLRKSER